jgi:cytochrome c-type biogenesis protein CcmF
MDIQYIGEHLLPGQLGNLLLVLSFTAALLSSIAYYFASNQNELENNSWHKIGRMAFYLHGFSVIAVMVTLFYIIFANLIVSYVISINYFIFEKSVLIDKF